MDHKKIPQALALLLMTIPLSSRGWARSAPSCERYALHDLSLGMSHHAVRLKMRGEGVSAIIQTPDTRETSGADYPGPLSDVYVEYDHRVDRRPRARTVLVRASIRLSPETAEALVDRFGPPDAGADYLGEGLNEGVAVWVDEACGVMLSAYRSRVSLWTAEAGPLLQLETLDHARRDGPLASSRLEAVLARKNAPPALAEEATIAAGSPTEDPVIPLLPMSEVEAGSIGEASLVLASSPEDLVAPVLSMSEADADSSGVASLLPANSPEDLVIPLLPMSTVDASSIGVASLLLAILPEDPVVVPPRKQLQVAPPVSARLFGSEPTAPSAPQTIATWHPSANTAIPSAAPRTTAPSVPQTIANWHPSANTASTPSSAPRTTAPSAPQTIANWHPLANTASTPSSAPRPTTPSAPQTIATWHPQTRTASTPSSAPKASAPSAPQTLPTLRVSKEPSDVPHE